MLVFETETLSSYILSNMPEHLTPNSEPVKRFIDWHEAAQAPYGLNAGDVVTGFSNLLDVDVLAHNIGRALHHPNYHGHQMECPTHKAHSTDYVGWLRSHPPSVAIPPKYFLGTFSDIGILMLDDEIVNAHRISVFPKRGFIISAAMRVSGKGIQGRLATECIIGTGVGRNSSGEKHPWLITATYKELRGQSADEITRMILEESYISAHIVTIRGLSRVLQGGLPE